MKNMKIPVENNLDEIVVELEKRGYECSDWSLISNTHFICTSNKGFYSNYSEMGVFWDENLTTLAELKGI